MSWVGFILTSVISGAVVLYASGGFSREFWWRFKKVGVGHCGFCGERIGVFEWHHVHGPNYIEYPGNSGTADGGHAGDGEGVER